MLGHLQPFRQNALEFLLQSAREYGDVVRFRLGPLPVHLLNEPNAIEQVLRSSNFDKATRSARFIRKVCGESLLSSNGPVWQRQRRMLQPFFHAQSVKGYFALMLSRTQVMLEQWRSFARSGESFDGAAEMMKLTCGIAAQAFFNAETADDVSRIGQAMEIILPHTFGQIQKVVNWPDWLPTAGNRTFRRALQDLDAVVLRLIENRRRSLICPTSGSDLLGMLLETKDETSGQPLSTQEIRDHTITFLLAGHETTSNALTWTLYLLAAHPEVQANLRQEIRGGLGSQEPTQEQLLTLASVRNALKEAMRLYPPIWIIERRVVGPATVLGFDIPAGSSVIVCPYTLHRHPAYWDRPDEFWPGRFEKGTHHAYLPFGAGPRHCIGSELAMLEALLVAALVLREFRVELVPGSRIEPSPWITLRARNGLPLRVRC